MPMPTLRGWWMFQNTSTSARKSGMHARRRRPSGSRFRTNASDQRERDEPRLRGQQEVFGRGGGSGGHWRAPSSRARPCRGRPLARLGRPAPPAAAAARAVRPSTSSCRLRSTPATGLTAPARTLAGDASTRSDAAPPAGPAGDAVEPGGDERVARLDVGAGRQEAQLAQARRRAAEPTERRPVRWTSTGTRVAVGQQRDLRESGSARVTWPMTPARRSPAGPASTPCCTPLSSNSFA